MRRTFDKMMQAFALRSFHDWINHFPAYLEISRGYQSPGKLVTLDQIFLRYCFLKKLLEQHSLKKEGFKKRLSI